ncbi:hypothetical protein DID88_010303 [Monilinia fructigena]|uniref:Reverse transcriptase domain-containing protein n=1 Tax=Monilinia fructigena TaxID=38457 RepID=A0A395IMX3_9HELO|nr:hypothetical protein DID88_010303 [Monilinia fructigena]
MDFIGTPASPPITQDMFSGPDLFKYPLRQHDCPQGYAYRLRPRNARYIPPQQGGPDPRTTPLQNPGIAARKVRRPGSPRGLRPAGRQAPKRRRGHRALLRKAKKAYWKDIINGVKDDKDLYKVINWHKLGTNLKAPPLVVNGNTVEGTMEKAETLWSEVLDRFSASDDLAQDPLEPWDGAGTLPWSDTISMEEVERNTIGVSSTSPGTDRVTGPSGGFHYAKPQRRLRHSTGIPLSPVLYMLYLAELLSQDSNIRFGYADDICLYKASTSVDINVASLATEIRNIMHWGTRNKIAFAPEKLEMIHLTRKNGSRAPDCVVSQDLVIPPITTSPKKGDQPALRWLGVWFDRRLTFKRHVAERAGKARQIARHIRGLAKTVDGPPASALRKAVITCVIPSLTYGTEAWYAGRTKPLGFSGLAAARRSAPGWDGTSTH